MGLGTPEFLGPGRLMFAFALYYITRHILYLAEVQCRYKFPHKTSRMRTSPAALARLQTCVSKLCHSVMQIPLLRLQNAWPKIYGGRMPKSQTTNNNQ